VILYKRLDPAGKIISEYEHRGDFERVVRSVDANGKSYELITWNNVFTREKAAGDREFSAYKPQPWLSGFSYPFSAEDSHQDFHWKYDIFPKTREGYLSLMLTVDAHFEFDYLRSSFHGAIEKLRRIGDEVEAPDSRLTFSIDFPPVVPRSHLRKTNVFTKFLGITQVNNEPCAILAHRQGPGDFVLDFSMDENAIMRMNITSSFRGNLFVRLSDGSLVHGDFIEYVRSQGTLPKQDKPTYFATQAEYNIDEISRVTYLKSLNATR
jgi:hypothetical protein